MHAFRIPKPKNSDSYDASNDDLKEWMDANISHPIKTDYDSRLNCNTRCTQMKAGKEYKINLVDCGNCGAPSSTRQ